MVSLTSIFPADTVPVVLKERYRDADGPTLKVALFLLCNGASELPDMKRELHLDSEVLERAIHFWQSAGLVLQSEPVPRQDEIRESPGKKALQPTRTYLTQTQISHYALINPDIPILLQESESLLGRFMSMKERETLVTIHECDGLPVDVILTILSYCLPRAKNIKGVVYLAERVALEWIELGITDLVHAEQHIRNIELQESREKQVIEVLQLDKGHLTANQKVNVRRWFEEYGFTLECIREVYLRTGKNSVNYVNSVLRSWAQDGLTTLQKIRAQGSNAPAPSKKKSPVDATSLLRKAIKKQMAGGIPDDAL